MKMFLETEFVKEVATHRLRMTAMSPEFFFPGCSAYNNSPSQFYQHTYQSKNTRKYGNVHSIGMSTRCGEFLGSFRVSGEPYFIDRQNSKETD